MATIVSLATSAFGTKRKWGQTCVMSAYRVKMPDSELRQQFIEIAREHDALAAAIERRLSRT
jgi:hypothetical protein